MISVFYKKVAGAVRTGVVVLRPGRVAKRRRPELESRLFFAQRRPAESRRERGLIVFALDHVLGSDLVEPENFVVEIEAIGIESEAVRQADAALRVDFKV